MATNRIMSRQTYQVVSYLTNWIIAVAIIAALTFNLGISVIPSSSMLPTFNVGTLVVFRNTNPENLKHDDIVLFFQDPSFEGEIDNGWEYLWASLVLHDTALAKRVIGLPGDTIEIKNGYVWRNGEMLDPDYLDGPTLGTMAPVTVPDGEMFCMGDNRQNSADSRVFGTFPMRGVIGKPLFIIRRPQF